MPSNAKYQLYLPKSEWNGALVVYSHGCISPAKELRIPKETPVLASFFTKHGYAFGVTSFRVNGLSAIKQGPEDLIELVEAFISEYGRPNHCYILGVSIGGSIAVKCAEEYSDLFDGVLTLSGLNGNFINEINYLFDFRTVFDYFFPEVFSCETVDIPQNVGENWDKIYRPRIVSVLTAYPEKTRQLLSVTRIPVDKNNDDMVVEYVNKILWFTIFSTNDLIENIHGNPYDNSQTYYWGSDNDRDLNRCIKRYRSDYRTIREIQMYYQTNGRINIPLVTIHSTGDPLIPFIQQFMYQMKVCFVRRSHLYSGISNSKHGHAHFYIKELADAFGLLVFKVTGKKPNIETGTELRGHSPFFPLF